jgi:hypothetical protein
MGNYDKLGKNIGGIWYFHADYTPAWAMKKVMVAIKYCPQGVAFNVVKISKDGVSFLWYRRFMGSHFPELVRSITVRNKRAVERFYNEDNPPIFHRKELLIPEWHAEHKRAKNLTERCEAAGLFENSHIIGRKVVWQKMLKEAGIR